MALSRDQQEQLERLKNDILAADSEADEHADRRLRPLTDLEEYGRPGGPLDLELALMRDGLSATNQGLPRPRLLVMLCGTAAAPLLLSQRLIDPEKIWLVASRSQVGEAGMRTVRAQMPSARLLSPELLIADDRPEVAFRELDTGLAEVMKQRGLGPQDVLIDITGGKKTMTAAAFLVASERGIDTTYVDGEPLPRLRLVMPGTQRIYRLTDPTRHFWLRERRAALDFFDRGDYRMAAELLKKMRREEDARRADAAACWQDARYADAVSALATLPIPAALQQLAQDVPVLSGAWTKPRSSQELKIIFKASADKERLLRFCADRLGWGLHAFQHGHLRRAFLDAFSACDALLEVRGTNMSHAELGKEKPLRLHRNALVHRIQSPDPTLVDKLLKPDGGRSCLAQQVLEKEAGQADFLPRGNLLVQSCLAARQSGIAQLRPQNLDEL